MFWFLSFIFFHFTARLKRLLLPPAFYIMELIAKLILEVYSYIVNIPQVKKNNLFETVFTTFCFLPNLQMGLTC
jgi:hypothetical protein